MFPYLSTRRGGSSRPAAGRRGRRPNAAAPQLVERLEDRRLLSAVGGGPTIDLSQLHVDPSEHASTHVLVRFKDGARPPAGLRGEELIAGSGLWKVRLGQGQGVADAVAAFGKRSDVLYAQPDYKVRIQGWQDTDNPRDDPVNDYIYQVGEMWGLENDASKEGKIDSDIDAPKAWYAAMQAAGKVGGMGVTVAILDTGIDYAHPDLYLNVWVNQGEIPQAFRIGGSAGLRDVDADGLVTFRDLNHAENASVVAGLESGADGTANAPNDYLDAGDLLAAWSDGLDGDDAGVYVDDLFGWDFHNNDNNPLDDHSHGTHVAGTIGAIPNNNDKPDGTRYEARGVVGVAWEVSLMGLKFLDSLGGGDTSNAIKALDYAVSQGVKISNNSWGGAPYEQALFDAIQRATSAGHLFVAAAGNGDWLGRAKNNDTSAHYPSNYRPATDTVLAVAATDSSDRMASFSNYGATTVDLAAPGVRIWSTVPIAEDTDGTPEGLTRYDGTSMATPHVAGTAALMLAVNPNLTALEIKQILMGTTDYVGDVATSFGTNKDRPTMTNGRLNAHRAVAEAAARAVPSLAIGDVTVVEGDSGAVIARFTVTRSGDTAKQVTVGYSTADGSATAGSDYATASGSLTFLSGETSKVVEVTVHGDAAIEPDETFSVVLSGAVGGTITDPTGVGTILDDDSPPTIAIDDVSVVEGDAGTVSAVFTVTLSKPGSRTVTVGYATADGTATGGGDYSAAGGTLTFAPGETSRTVTITVHGDTAVESNETFFVNLSAPTDATLADAQGRGTITNDDASRQTFASSDVPAPLRGWTTTISYLTIDQDLRISDLNVRVDVSHNNVKDLDIYLYAPDGRRVALFWGRGGSGDHIRATFDDEAALHISQGRAPFDGIYRPEQALAAFDGMSARGTWQLRVENWGSRKGTVNSWSVVIDTTTAVGTTAGSRLSSAASGPAKDSDRRSAFAGPSAPPAAFPVRERNPFASLLRADHSDGEAGVGLLLGGGATRHGGGTGDNLSDLTLAGLGEILEELLTT